MRAVLILNPVSGISSITTLEGTQTLPQENEQAILAALRTYGIEPEVLHTSPEDTGQALAAQAALDHVELVIVAGGDGTVHAVASGLIGTQSSLGIIPTGTMNNLAHSLSIPRTIETACAIIAQGETQAIDVGKINDHVFLEVAGIGLEAALFPAAEKFKSPNFLAMLHGVINGLKTLFTFQATKLRITFDDRRRRHYSAIQVTICNSPYYGVHLQLAPEIVMNDGLFDVVIFKNFSKLEYIRHAISISQGRRIFQPKITHRRARSLRISTDLPVEIHADGVLQGYTPAVVTIIPGALRVRVPAVDVPGLLGEPEDALQTNSATKLAISN